MSQSMISKKRREFIGLSAPLGYVAGVGRGATGFTTRSDIGPAREATDVSDERHMAPSKRKKEQEKEEEQEEDFNESNYDEVRAFKICGVVLAFWGSLFVCYIYF